MKKTYDVLLVLTLILIFASIVDGANNTSAIYNNTYNNDDNVSNKTSDTYKILIDGYKGFYRIYRMYDMKAGEDITSTEFDNHTLNIHLGDTVTWGNEDPTETLTVISKPALWKNSTAYIRPAKLFTYKFNKTGTYDVYIRQHQDAPHMKIIASRPGIKLAEDEIEGDDTNINRTIILKTNHDEYGDTFDDNAIGQESPKSKVVIKTYRKSKQLPGIGTIVTIPIILLVYICRRKIKIR